MGILLAAPGRPLFGISARALLTGSSGVAGGGGGGSGGGSTFTGPFPSDISGLSGWWDAGLLSGIAQPTPGWSQPVANLIDKSGGARAITPTGAAGGGGDPSSGPIAMPRLNGALGGVSGYLINGSVFGMWSPAIDNAIKWPLANVQMGSGTGWTRYLVYSRANMPQSYVDANTGAVTPLMTIGSTVVLALTSIGAGNDQLILFPGAGQTVLASNLTRRHTHSVTIRNTPGAGLDIWLDDASVATAHNNPLPLSDMDVLTLLGDATTNNGAPCYLHEFATWERPLAASEIVTLLVGSPSISKRWVRGNRPGAIVIGVGQSNAEHWQSAGGRYAMEQTIRYYLGALAVQLISTDGGTGGTGFTTAGGTPIFQDASPSTQGWLATPSPITDPVTGAWGVGFMGAGFEALVSGASNGNPTPPLNADDMADIMGVYLHWSENDSLHGYPDKGRLESAARRMITLMRAAIGKTATQTPVMWLNALPYTGSFNQPPVSGDTGIQAHREMVADLAADPTMNLALALPMTADAIGLGATYDASTGLWTGGDNSHMDDTDQVRYGRLAGVVMARALLTAGFSDIVTALPAGIPAVGGPVISHAYLQNSTTVIVTVTHDAGTDLVVPLQAVSGVGWTIMAGGTVASPGVLIQAAACARIDATHLQLTFPAIPDPAASCLLFYPWGSAKIGRGDAVTDNYASVAKPAGYDAGADLGALWNLNYPLAATTYGFPLSATP